MVKGPGLESSDICVVPEFDVTQFYLSLPMHLHTWRDSVHVSASGVEGHISRASGHHGFKFGTVTRKICTPSI